MAVIAICSLTLMAKFLVNIVANNDNKELIVIILKDLG